MRRVLIVDDDPKVCETLDRYLAHAGYATATALDGAKALELAQTFAPDLVVLDLMLPRIGGLEVCRMLRETSAVPIIMLTAKTTEHDKLTGLSLGADDYLTKPFSPRELVARVEAVVAVTLGSAAIISTRVAHYEIRKFEVDVHGGRKPLAISDYYRTHRTWTGVDPAVDAFANTSGSDIALFDDHNRLVGASKALHGATLDLGAYRMLTITRNVAGGRTRELIRGPQAVVRDANGVVAGSIFILPPHKSVLPQPTRSLDRSFFWTFLGATLFGILMAIAIARWISVPVERLTAAARRMESGDLAVRVEPAGGAELAELAHGFNAMAAALDRNEEQRKRMVSDVAHELRAPLTNIRCELESMQDGLTAPTPERIASLHDETMHLAHLVDDLQDLALAEAGRLEIDAQPGAISALAKRAAAGMEMRARES